MQITSPSFKDGGEIPSRYTFDGENFSPPLHISDVPDNAESLALIVEDIDSPLGSFTHWIVWNIPPDTTEINENEVPSSAELGMNGFGSVDYGGPCPPSGHHRYRFRLFALDSTLDATSPDRKDQIESDIEDAALAQATLIGHYGANG